MAPGLSGKYLKALKALCDLAVMYHFRLLCPSQIYIFISLYIHLHVSDGTNVTIEVLFLPSSIYLKVTFPKSKSVQQILVSKLSENI